MSCEAHEEDNAMKFIVERARGGVIAAAVLLALTTACGRKHQRAHVPRPPSASRAQAEASRPAQTAVPLGVTEQGIASWYGIPYHGRPAADGEIYDMEKLVAAHRTMPFNTWLKVTNLNNGLTVNVRVIDRGPFVDGRIVDLSKAAARQIQMIGTGIAPVKVEVIAAPMDLPANDFYAVQIGVFSNYANAERLRAKYAASYGTANIDLKLGRVQLWRVLVGKEASAEAAMQLAERLKRELKFEVFVVRLDAQLEPTTPNAAASAPPSHPEVDAQAPSPTHRDSISPSITAPEN
jgi:peptidoglycan lytic transglycosylase